MTVRELINKLSKIQDEHGGHLEVCVSADGLDYGTIESVQVEDCGTCWIEV